MSSDMKDTELRQELADVLMTPNQAWRGMKKIPIELIWGLEQLIKRETDRAVMGELQDMLDGYKFSLKDEPTGTVYVFAPILHALDHRIAQLKQQQGE